MPHISLVFREMWDSTAVHRSLSTGNRFQCPWSSKPCTLKGQGLWNPTSREKRARYGAPVIREGTKALRPIGFVYEADPLQE